MQLFQYAILWSPNEQEKKEGKKPEILKDVTSIIGPNQQYILMVASSLIPEEYKTNIDQIQIPIAAF